MSEPVIVSTVDQYDKSPCWYPTCSLVASYLCEDVEEYGGTAHDVLLRDAEQRLSCGRHVGMAVTALVSR